MEWDDLKYVLATARSGSFLHAAHMLKVTHTTVGRRIKALETDLGHLLFRRTRDGVEATELCLRILPIAEDIEQKVRAISLSVETKDAEPEGRVRIHTAAWIIEHILIPAYPAFRETHPKVQVFFVGDVVDSIDDPTTPAISLRFDVMAKRTEIEAEIAEIPFATYRARSAVADRLEWATSHGGRIKMRTAEWLERQGIPLEDVGVLANDAQLVKSAILTGRYKGLLPQMIGAADDRLVRETAGSKELVRRLRSIVPRRALIMPEVQAVVDWSRTSIKDAEF